MLFPEYLGVMEEKINSMLKEEVAKLSIPSNNIKTALTYALQGGKRFRPAIMGFLAKEIDVDEEDFLLLACSLEMIHAYTLVHDDLPAMDNDDIRRGQPSLHKKFNEYTAILTGDALQSEAFYMLSSSRLNIPTSLQLQVINIVADSIGSKNLISGQMFDLEFNKTLPANLPNLQTIHLLKTAKFMALPLVIVAMLAYKDSHFIARLQDYGEKLGIMFQIADDLQDTKDKGVNIVNFLGKNATFNLLEELNNTSKQQAINLGLKDMHQVNDFIMGVTNNA
ncbi:Farnesyl diphosphate synthase [Candidatus Hepatincola sp. Av]